MLQEESRFQLLIENYHNWKKDATPYLGLLHWVCTYREFVAQGRHPNVSLYDPLTIV